MTSTGGAAFAYDAAGRRASRTAGGVTTSFLYDGGGVLLEKQGSTTTATYTYGNSLIRKDGETPLFDGLGSERTVTNSSQAVTASLTLSAFGQTVVSTGSSSSAYGFGATSGYRTEGDAGLTLVGCRFYDAQVGRFITRDTYLDQAPYAYCDGDPVNAVDPDGHEPQTGDPPGGRAPYPPLPKPSPPSDPGGIPTPSLPVKIKTGGGGEITGGPTQKDGKLTGGTIIFGHPLPGGGEIGVGVYAPIHGPTQYGLSFILRFG